MLNPTSIYEADVINLKTSRKFYIGLSDAPFKERYKTISVILETSVTRKALSFQNILGTFKKVV